MFIFSNFTARVSADHASWPHQIGHHGVGNMNENAQQVLKLCAKFDLCVTNTYFCGSKWKRASWHHPCSGHWNQLDFVLAHCKQIQNVLHTATHHRADCDTDHALVHLKICLSHLRKQKKGTSDSVHRKVIHTSSMKNWELIDVFEGKLGPALNTTPPFNSMKRGGICFVTLSTPKGWRSLVLERRSLLTGFRQTWTL